MRVAYVPSYGPPEVVEFREVPTPEPGRGQVRVKIFATTVTAGDWRVRSGILPRGFGPLRGLALGFGRPRKAVLGTEAAGVIDAVGPGVTRFSVGDPVVVFPSAGMGAHAEYLVVSEGGCLAQVPSSLTFEEAAALPFGGLTALDYLRRGKLKAGERVLINGASGNVGTACVQLAKHQGAHVTAVCSAGNAELVRSLGADEVIDYATTDFTSRAELYDVIVDAVGNAPYARSRSVLAQGGRLLAVAGDLPATLGGIVGNGFRKHRVVAGVAGDRPEDLRALVDLAAQGVFRAVTDQQFPFAQIVEAYRVVDSGRKRGSVVLVVDDRAGDKELQ